MSWQGSSCSVGSFRRRSAFATSLSRRRERASRAFQEKTCPGLDPDSIRAGEHRQIQCPLPALRIGPCQKALMSRLPEPSDSNYDACEWIAEGMISEFLENGLARENCMSGDVTEVLAGFAASQQYEDLPGHVRDHCKNVLLDTLACAVAGHRGEETQQLAAMASGLAQSNESSVIGGDRLSLAGATILNGYLVTAVTMCDVHRPTLTHVTPEVIPPALAIAERDGSSGRDLLVAIAAGCEVTTRIGIGLDYRAFRAKGWHGPGVLGPFGAAAGSQDCWRRCSPSRTFWRLVNFSPPPMVGFIMFTRMAAGRLRSSPSWD